MSLTRNRAALAVFLVALSVLLLFPIWGVAFPPLLDYPNHLARAFVLLHLHDPHFSFSQWYRADWGLYPYLGMDASLAVLGRIFPIEMAGRIFLSLCALLLPASAWFFLRQAHPGEDWSACWTLLIAWNVFFLEGFLNFDISLAFALIALGLWLRWLASPGFLRWLAAALAFLCLYFAHLIGFALAGLIVTAYALFSRRSLRTLLFSWLLFVPGAIAYLHSSRVGLGKQTIIYQGWDDKLDALGKFMHGYSPALDTITLIALAAFFLLGWFRNPKFRWDWPWFGVAAVLFGAFWAIPWAYGEGSDLDIRVLPLLFVAILAVARIGPRGRWLAALPLLLFLARTISVTREFRAEQPELAGLANSFDLVPRDALVFPVVEGDQDPIARPFTHFWAYGVIRRGWFSPYLFDHPGETPMRITYESYTADGFWDLSYDSPDTPPDWPDVRGDYQYVWAYGVPRFSVPLAGIGDRIYSSGPLEVYRLHPPPE
jgi:hypothetical protein